MTNLTPEEKIAKATKLLEEAKAELQKKDGIVYVPDCIEITKSCWCESMWIRAWVQKLYFNNSVEMFWIYSESVCDSIKCKLVKVNREDREVGKIYFETDNDDFSNMSDIRYYNLYLWEKNYLYWSDRLWVNVPLVSDDYFANSYEVVAV